MKKIADELNCILKAEGAELIGYADLHDVQGLSYPYGVAVAVSVPKEIIIRIEDGPTAEYLAMYDVLNEKLNRMISAGAEYLTRQGYAAAARTTDRVVTSDSQRTDLPHKTVAVRAGLGWIGKSNLLVTPRYGSAVRISAILTDAPLPCAEAPMEARCGDCTACAAACPGGAIYGTRWEAGMDRDSMFRMEACRETANRLSLKRIGKPTTLCGKCFVVCPYTRRYMKPVLK